MKNAVMFYVIVMYNVHLGIRPVFTGSYLRSSRIRIRAGSSNFTGYPAGSGSGSGAPLVVTFVWRCTCKVYAYSQYCSGPILYHVMRSKYMYIMLLCGRSTGPHCASSSSVRWFFAAYTLLSWKQKHAEKPKSVRPFPRAGVRLTGAPTFRLKSRVMARGLGCAALGGRSHNMSALGGHIFLVLISLQYDI